MMIATILLIANLAAMIWGEGILVSWSFVIIFYVCETLFYIIAPFVIILLCLLIAKIADEWF